MFDEFFAKAYELTQQGIAFATATVVRAEKPTSGKPGDRAIITADGELYGWIGGSCAQPTVIKEALKVLAEDECRLIRLSTEPDTQPARPGVMDLPMTCFSGGTMEIYIEPQQPRPRLLIVGTLPVAQALAQLGKTMNYQVTVVDPDAVEAAEGQTAIASLNELLTHVTPLTYVVVATHGTYDEAALEILLRGNAPYVGLVASHRRADSVRDYLVAQGITNAELAVLKVPAGLDIHARRGDEIALSIMAEIVQRRRSHEKVEWAGEVEEVVETQPLPVVMASGLLRIQDFPYIPPSTETVKAGIAIDPICQMEVIMATAAYRSEYEGNSYYFCCGGCKRTFDKNPAPYVPQAAPQA